MSDIENVVWVVFFGVMGFLLIFLAIEVVIAQINPRKADNQMFMTCCPHCGKKL